MRNKEFEIINKKVGVRMDDTFSFLVYDVSFTD